MRHFFFFLLISIVFVNTGKAQENFNGFTDFKRISENQAVVYFTVTSEDAFKIDELNEMLLRTDGVYSSSYKKDKDIFRFKSVIDKSVTDEDIKIILAQQNMKINADGLYNKNNDSYTKKELSSSNEQSPAPHYPVFVDTGNPEYDALQFDKAKQEWIVNYPEEVEKLTSRSYKMSTGIVIPGPEKNK